MKEMKFRVWHNGKWNYFIIGGLWDTEVQKAYLECCIDGCTFYQFTGLKDNNGKEIYEGDILRSKNFLNCKDLVVDFNNGGFTLYGAKHACDHHYSKWLHADSCDSEVIGNFYENPELREVKE